MDNNELISLIKDLKYVTILSLQKKLGCGFTRAGKIIKSLQTSLLISTNFEPNKGYAVLIERN